MSRPPRRAKETDPLARLHTALTDRYRIERELGRGGTATVYRAEDLRHHRQVALKVLRPELLSLTGDSISCNAHRPGRGPGGVRLGFPRDSVLTNDVARLKLLAFDCNRPVRIDGDFRLGRPEDPGANSHVLEALGEGVMKRETPNGSRNPFGEHSLLRWNRIPDPRLDADKMIPVEGAELERKERSILGRDCMVSEESGANLVQKIVGAIGVERAVPSGQVQKHFSPIRCGCQGRHWRDSRRLYLRGRGLVGARHHCGSECEHCEQLPHTYLLMKDRDPSGGTKLVRERRLSVG